MFKGYVTLTVAVLACVLTGVEAARGDVPAFSGAEGWGAITLGGRGGTVYHVTNLSNSGPGSFRAACEASGPRTVVFDISGKINLTSELNILNPYITIAGQTAPGDGVCIAGETVSVDTTDVIIRYMRFRRGETDPNRRDDALGSDSTHGKIMIDHVSASWGFDENLSIYRWKDAAGHVYPTENVTIQWSVSSEALNWKYNHGFGATWGGTMVSYHHNLFACNRGRNPSISWSHLIDYRNNVVYNWRDRTMDGAGAEAHVNVVNNYYKPGPALDPNQPQLAYRIVKPELRGGTVGYGAAGWWYVNGNYVDSSAAPGFVDANACAAVNADNWNGGVQWEIPGMQTDWARSTTPFTYAPVVTQSAVDAYQSVLAGAGAVLPTRDAVDQRIMGMVAEGSVTYGDGIIDFPSDVGGYPTYAGVSRPAGFDTDGDGMPNTWELAYGLDPNSAADRNGDLDSDGFTNLEEYLNELGAFRCPKPIVWNGGDGRYELIENWDVAFQPSRLDAVQINSGRATVAYLGQTAGTMYVGSSAGELAVTAGSLAVANGIYLGNASGSRGTLTATGGTLKAGGQIVLASSASSTGEMTVGKNAYVQAAGLTINSGSGRSSKVNVEIASDGTSLIRTTGSSTLGGVLDVQYLKSVRPKEGDAFKIIDSSDPNATYSGSFADVTGNITLGIPSWLDAFGGRARSGDYELVFQGLTEGDASGDHQVGTGDLALMAGSWLGSGKAWANGDFTGDGVVGTGDLALMAGNWLWMMPSPAPDQPIPEPATMGLLALSGLALLRRRQANR